MTGRAILTVENLTAGYGGGGQVLQGIDIEVPEGEVVVLLGANGAGKTTLMRCVTGTLPYQGDIAFGGVAQRNPKPERIVRAGVACVPQGRGTFNELSVLDNLRLGALCLPRSEREPAVDLWFDRLPRLAERSDVRAGMLSGGEQQMLAVARACLTKPRILLCDEPSLGLSPAMSHEVFAIFAELHSSSGLSMLVVEQNANLALSIADHAYVLEGGQIVWQGTPAELESDDALVSAYIGDLEDAS